MKGLKNNGDYQYAKRNNIEEITKPMEEDCSVNIERFNLYNNSSNRLIDSVAMKNNSDFIIINRALNSLSNEKPTLTILKFKNQNKYYTLHNYYKYYEDNNNTYVATDSQLIEYKPEENFKIIEDYMYLNIPNIRISKKPKKLGAKGQYKAAYFIIARISGKIITKTIYFADDYDN